MMRALLILDESAAAAAMTRVSRLVHITQQLPPRLALVEGGAAAVDQVRTVAGVRAVCTKDINDSLLEELTEPERLFAEAWKLSLKPKGARVGEGLPWDAEGFQAPDRTDE